MLALIWTIIGIVGIGEIGVTLFLFVTFFDRKHHPMYRRAARKVILSIYRASQYSIHRRKT